MLPLRLMLIRKGAKMGSLPYPELIHETTLWKINKKKDLWEAGASGYQKTSCEEEVENSDMIWEKLNAWDQSLITFFSPYNFIFWEEDSILLFLGKVFWGILT